MSFKIFIKGVFVIFMFAISGCMSRTPEKGEWQSLFNGNDLSGWDTYLGPVRDTVLNKWGTVPTGLNNDPEKVFSVVDMDGVKVIRISGEQFGGFSTTSEYENYHLQLKFKWGKLQWAPRKTSKKDSGLMYHAVGPHGADGGFWMRSHEFQIQEGDCGDYWACAGAVFDVPAKMEEDSSYFFSNEGSLVTFSQASKPGRHCKKFPDAEKPVGEWNTIDLYCYGSTSVHVLNGVINMVLYNSRQLDGDKELPLSKGKIQIQSEGAEVFFKDIKINNIKGIPDHIIKRSDLTQE